MWERVRAARGLEPTPRAGFRRAPTVRAESIAENLRALDGSTVVFAVVPTLDRQLTD